jgi:hypothetical protein
MGESSNKWYLVKHECAFCIRKWILKERLSKQKQQG